MYVASAIYIALFMIILGKYSRVKSVARGLAGDALLLPHVRGLVQGAAVQGHASTRCASSATELSCPSASR